MLFKVLFDLWKSPLRSHVLIFSLSLSLCKNQSFVLHMTFDSSECARRYPYESTQSTRSLEVGSTKKKKKRQN